MKKLNSATCVKSTFCIEIGFVREFWTAVSKNTSVLVVVKKFADALCGKINLSHAVVPLKQWFGQKPGSVSALAGLRHFSTWRLM